MDDYAKMNVIEYILSNGRIIGSGSGDLNDIQRLPEHGWVEGDPISGFLYYVDITADPPVVIERPVQSTTLAGTALTNLPIPATLYINGEAYAIDDGEAELNILLPGTYRLRVESWPYQDWEEEVTI